MTKEVSNMQIVSGEKFIPKWFTFKSSTLQDSQRKEAKI